ncbi:serine/threonine-protein kinase [Streptomyces qinzhouensis]|uniref:non-specific serine/threonine protein kinase n=1 Tax=Streptomyces qinzhouensis TaxID=2599401 RepID=A0A5B8JLJ3_9ACTN|nr:serine/threonine-protein kinase [Streptomyces qinzhouensis]QDY78590.1 protein kinase [Streptomyces qinzhouensis]
MSEAEQSRKPQRDGSEERASAAAKSSGSGSGARSGTGGDTDRAAGAADGRDGARSTAAGSPDTTTGGKPSGKTGLRTSTGAESPSADGESPAGDETAEYEGGEAVAGRGRATGTSRRTAGKAADGTGAAGPAGKSAGPRAGAEPVIGPQADRRAKEKPDPAPKPAAKAAKTAPAAADDRAAETANKTAGAGEKDAPAADDRASGRGSERSGTDGGAKKGGDTPARGRATDSGKPGGTARGSGSGSGSGSGDSEGRLLAGRYRLGGVLGRGGMGTVWRAEDETLSRTVAVKELRFPHQIDEDEKRRLITRTLREAKAIARIRNTSAVTVYDVVDEDDRPWIVMELVEGKSLAEVIREDGTLTPRRAAEVGLAILDVLRSAHREGILHRDVKPSNVLIAADDGRVVLTDFGIALVEGDPSITSTGMLVGAPSYISPERARGQRPGPAADLWSLGGLIYASVEGSPPYDKGSAIATLTAVMTEPLDPPKNAGPLEEVIYGLLAKDPAQRLDDAGARALLTRALNAPDVPVEPPLPPDATRAMTLPTIPPPEPAAPARTEPPRGPVRPARNAAPAAAAAARPPQQPPSPPVQRAAPRRAPLTDVVPRRTLVLLAVGIALAILGTVMYLTIGRNNDGDGSGNAGGDRTTSAGTTPETGTKDGKTAGGGEKPADTTDGKGTSDGATGKDGATGASKPPTGTAPGKGALPAGYAEKTDARFRFSMAMPAGFRLTDIAGASSGGIYNTGKGAFPRVQVDFNNKPGTDAVAAWENSVAGTRGASTNYQHRGIKAVQYNGYRTVADWEFERDHDGKRMRVLNRGFVVDDKRGYSIMVSCPVAEWDAAACKTLRETAFATFKPKD